MVSPALCDPWLEPIKPLRARILIFNDTPRNGGPGKVLLHFLRYANRAHLYVGVHLMRPDVLSEIYLDEGVADEVSFDANLIENPIQPYGRPMERRDFDAPLWRKTYRIITNVPRAFFGLAALAKLMRKGGYDLLYCNGLYAVIVGGLLARFAGIPVLWHLHDTSLPKALSGIFRWMARSDNVRGIICVSKASAAMVDFAPNKAIVVLNPVDLSEFDRSIIQPVLRQEMQWNEDAIIFGSHGRVVARKGYLTMIHAARLAIDLAPPDIASRMRFAVIGDTPADHPGDHLAECRALVDQQGLNGVFVFAGYRKDVRPYIADYSVCVVPSIFDEPFGLSIVEGYAFGVPVIASAVGGIPEIVHSGETGMLVAPGNPHSLATAMIEYARDEDLRVLHGAAAQYYVARHHAAPAYAAKIEQYALSAAHRLQTLPFT